MTIFETDETVNQDTPDEAPELDSQTTEEANNEDALCDIALTPEEELSNLKDQLLRTAAELDNARKRAQKDIVNARKYGSEYAVASMIPVRDSLDLALNASGEELPDTLRKGLEATMKLFDDNLVSLGVTVLNPQGRAFDPALHEAIAMQDAEDKEPGTILEVIQKGFQLHDRILRPARVIVSKKS
jgi:molecular chaperone GrpE